MQHLDTEYRTIARKATSWLVENIQQFSLQDDKDDTKTVSLLKPLAELALTADIVSRQSDMLVWPELRSASKELLEYCWKELKEGKLLIQFLNRYPELIIYSTIYPPFERHGYVHTEFVSTLQALLHVRGFVALEYPGWRALDLAVAVKALGLQPPWDIEEQFRRTWLYQTPEPWSLREESAYAVTHTVSAC